MISTLCRRSMTALGRYACMEDMVQHDTAVRKDEDKASVVLSSRKSDRKNVGEALAGSVDPSLFHTNMYTLTECRLWVDCTQDISIVSVVASRR